MPCFLGPFLPQKINFRAVAVKFRPRNPVHFHEMICEFVNKIFWQIAFAYSNIYKPDVFDIMAQIAKSNKSFESLYVSFVVKLPDFMAIQFTRSPTNLASVSRHFIAFLSYPVPHFFGNRIPQVFVPCCLRDEFGC